MEGINRLNTPFEKPSNVKLEKTVIDGLLLKYGEHGLSVDGEYFVIAKDGGEIRFHTWENIPYSQDGGKTVLGIPIEDHIKKHLGIA